MDVLIVGAGFGGLYMLHRARCMGLETTVLEAADGVGGTWYWNRYPGARCDIESLEYSFGFDEALQQEWRWTERFAAQPEILAYANHVADRFGLRPHIRLGTRVAAATFDDAAARWRVTTDKGETLEARFLVMATGCLSSANLPDIAGRDSFAGRTFHTGRWPHEAVDFTGRRVGVIGTGSSAVQSIPLIAGQAKELVVFQRTATYSVPARNAPLDPAEDAEVKANYAELRRRNRQMLNAFGARTPRRDIACASASAEERERAFEERWQLGGLFYLGAFNDLMLDAGANAAAAEFVRRKIRAVVQNPETAMLLTPTQPIGCKRLCIDTGYYETFNRPNVQLVDVTDTPIQRITAKGVIAGGREFVLEDLVFATGFDAMTGALAKIDIRGKGGVSLAERWAAGPRNYLGLAVVGFPNLFMITGPGSPSVLTNMMVSIEQHVEWISACLAAMAKAGHARIEARPEAEDAWVAHVNAVADRTLFPGCNSWYLGANVPGKPRVFMPLVGFPAYEQKCAEVAAQGYEGFALQ